MATISTGATVEPTATVFILITRKPGTTLEEFKSYYENVHNPLLMRLLMYGDFQPLIFTRSYIERDSVEGAAAASFPFGGGEDFQYDCITRLVFRNTQHRDAMFGEFVKHQEEIHNDDDKFLDRSKLKFMYITESPTNVRKE